MLYTNISVGGKADYYVGDDSCKHAVRNKLLCGHRWVIVNQLDADREFLHCGAQHYERGKVRGRRRLE